MEQFLARIGPRTRVVAFSWVQFQTGTVIDISAVVAAARRVHAWVVVDGIQGLGAMPFDFEASGVDAICGGTHKWLLGPLGLGFFALRHERIAELEPLLYGAFTYGTSEDAVDPTRRPRMDAKRFEPGTPLVLSAVPSAASLELLLEIGLDHVATEALTLRMIVEKEARTRGYGVRPHGSITSPIITIIPRTSPAALQTELSRRGISVAVRAGGLRISPHAHNEPRHIDALFAALDELDR